MPTTITIAGKTVKLTILPSGVGYYETKIGSGAVAASGENASMIYTGMLLDNSVFDSSAQHGGTPFTFQIGAGKVIKGWDLGVPGMKVGGDRRLVIPGNLAYGATSQDPKITPNAVLVFDVTLKGLN
jgi:FKBP-type peptidyl-prolyl cis-trans isomerase